MTSDSGKAASGIPEAIEAAYRAVREHFHDATDLDDHDELILRETIHVVLESAGPRLAAPERERAEALIIQAQDYASAESERAGKLAALALRVMNQCHALDRGDAAYLDEWSLELEQLEGAAGEMSPPDSDPLEDAYQTGIKAERERIARLAEQVGATYPFYEQPGLITAHLPFDGLLREDGGG